MQPSKVSVFQREVEFCGKLLSIQKWVLHRTVTELRQFLGLTNYFSEYVPNYAETAAPLTFLMGPWTTVNMGMVGSGNSLVFLAATTLPNFPLCYATG